MEIRLSSLAMDRLDVSPTEGLHPELGILFAAMQDGTREWQAEIGEPTREALVWQPYANGPSIGGQILHIASCEAYWLLSLVERKEPDLANPAVLYDRTLDQDNHHWPTPPNEPIEWYFKVLAEARAETFRSLERHGEPSKEYTCGYGLVTYRWILSHLVEHDSYHGGQAVLLHEMYKKLASSEG